MKRLFSLGLVLSLFHVEPASAQDDFDQTIQSTGTSASGTIKGGIQYNVQCDAAARYRVCKVSTCTAVTTDALIPANDLPYPVPVTSDAIKMAVISVSGTANCRLYKANPRTVPPL